MAEMSGSQKAALLLLMLGEDKAAQVLRHVDSGSVEQIGNAMASIEDVETDSAQFVLANCLQEMSTKTSLGVGVPGYMRTLLVNTLGEQRGRSLADKLLPDEESLEIDSLRWMNRDSIIKILKDEHPQIIAITLAHLDRAQAADVIKALPEEIQDDILYRIATMDKIPQSALKKLQNVLQNKLSLATSFKSKSIEGTKTAADILNVLGKENGDRVLTNIGETNEELSSTIREMMFVFDNLAEVDSKGMQTLLTQVSNDVLSVALKGADPEVSDNILENMSKRARAILEEDMEARGPVKIGDVQDAQKQIVEIAKALVDEGKISMGGSDDYVG